MAHPHREGPGLTRAQTAAMAGALTACMVLVGILGGVERWMMVAAGVLPMLFIQSLLILRSQEVAA